MQWTDGTADYRAEAIGAVWHVYRRLTDAFIHCGTVKRDRKDTPRTVQAKIEGRD